eukprot:COSAG03_NODE_764_length_5958_cov_2.656255_8_plen_304_part_00
MLDRQRLRRMVGSQASGRQQLHRTCRGNMTQRQEASERRQHRALERRRPRSKPRSGAGTPTARRSVAVAYGCQQCILHWLLARTKHERTATPRSPAGAPFDSAPTTPRLPSPLLDRGRAFIPARRCFLLATGSPGLSIARSARSTAEAASRGAHRRTQLTDAALAGRNPRGTRERVGGLSVRRNSLPPVPEASQLSGAGLLRARTANASSAMAQAAMARKSSPTSASLARSDVAFLSVQACQRACVPCGGQREGLRARTARVEIFHRAEQRRRRRRIWLAQAGPPHTAAARSSAWGGPAGARQ